MKKNEGKCNKCMLTKNTRYPFPKIENASKVLDLIHNNVCDLHGIPTLGGNKYFITFIDDFSRNFQVYLLHSKDEVMHKVKIYKSKVELHYQTFVKCLSFDRGGEFYDINYSESIGIKHEVVAPYTAQQTGIGERKISCINRNG